MTSPTLAAVPLALAVEVYGVLHSDPLTIALYLWFAVGVVAFQAWQAGRDRRLGPEGMAIAGTFLALSVVFVACSLTGYLPDHLAHLPPGTWWEEPAHALLNLSTLVLNVFATKTRVFYRAFTAPGRADSAERQAAALATALPPEASLALRAVDALDVIVAAVDGDNVVRLSLGNLLRRLGLEPGLLVGTRVEDVPQRAGAETVGEDEASIIRRVLRTGVGEEHDNKHPTPDGGVRHVQTQYRPDPAGPNVFILVFDVTDTVARRQRAEANAQQLRQYVGEEFDAWASERAKSHSRDANDGQ